MRSFDHRLPDTRQRGRTAGAGRTSSTPIRRCTASWCNCRCRRRSTRSRCSTRSIRPRTSTASIRSMPGGSRPACRRWCRARRSAASCWRRRCMPSLAGLEAVVIGRSNIVGKPVAQLLLAENATVTVAHSKTARSAGGVPPRRSADRGDRAAGNGARRLDQAGRDRDRCRHQPRAGRGRQDRGSSATWLSPKPREVAGAITPVPGGVGPMTIACLLVNTVRAACAIAGLPAPAV